MTITDDPTFERLRNRLERLERFAESVIRLDDRVNSVESCDLGLALMADRAREALVVCERCGDQGEVLVQSGPEASRPCPSCRGRA